MAAISFLRLPAEIRCMVYTFHFAGAVVTDCSRCDLRRPIIRGGRSKEWQILLTCCLVKQEARPIMYKSTLYVFERPTKFFTLDSRHPSVCHELRRILVKFYSPMNLIYTLRDVSMAAELLGSGGQLDYLEINTMIGRYHQVLPHEQAILESKPGRLASRFGPMDRFIMETLAEELATRGEVTVLDRCPSRSRINEVRRRCIARRR